MQSAHRHRFARLATIAAFVIGAAVITSHPVLAHHGWGGYLDQEFEISGTVESPVSVAGPHASVKIKASDGQVWNVLLAPPPRTESAGLKADTLPVGAQVTAYGHRHRDPKTFEVKTERLRWKDRLFNVYPDRT